MMNQAEVKFFLPAQRLSVNDSSLLQVTLLRMLLVCRPLCAFITNHPKHSATKIVLTAWAMIS